MSPLHMIHLLTFNVKEHEAKKKKKKRRKKSNLRKLLITNLKRQ